MTSWINRTCKTRKHHRTSNMMGVTQDSPQKMLPNQNSLFLFLSMVLVFSCLTLPVFGQSLNFGDIKGETLNPEISKYKDLLDFKSVQLDINKYTIKPRISEFEKIIEFGDLRYYETKPSIINGLSTAKVGQRVVHIFTLKLEEGICHPIPENRPDPSCPEDHLPVGEDIIEEERVGGFFFFPGVFDTGSEFIAIDNANGFDQSTARAAGLCGPRGGCGDLIPPGDPRGRSTASSIPESLTLNAWGLSVVEENGAIPLQQPQGRTWAIKPRVTGKVPFPLIGAPLANTVVAHIDFTNSVTRQLLIGPLTAPDVTFYRSYASNIPTPDYEVDLIRFGETGYLGAFDHATKGQRYFLEDFAFVSFGGSLEGGDFIANSKATFARALFDTGATVTQITAAAAYALGLDPKAPCKLPNCINRTVRDTGGNEMDLSCPRIHRFELRGRNRLHKYVIDHPFVCINTTKTSFTSVNDPSEASDVIIGTNYFDQTQILFNGSYNDSYLGMFVGVPYSN